MSNSHLGSSFDDYLIDSYKEDYDQYLFKFNVYDPDFIIMSRAELPPTGFSSLYAITQADAAALVSTSTSVNFKGSVWSPSLVLDIDSDEEARKIVSKLIKMELQFEVWETGNRGLHVYIDRPHAPSHMLPQLDKEWVQATFPEADTSVYSHLHLFRLPGAIHAKTGKRKVLRERYAGQPLLLADAPAKTNYKSSSGGTEIQESLFLNSHIMTLTVPWTNGKRHESLVNLGLQLKKMGEPIEFIHRWLLHTNALFDERKDESEIERIVQFINSAVL